MGLFSFLQTKKLRTWNKEPEVQEEAITRSLEIRQHEAEIRRLQHRYKVLAQEKRIAELQSDIEDVKGLFSDEEETPKHGIEDTLLTALISKILTPQNQQTEQSSIGITPQVVQGLSDDEIREQIKLVPKQYLSFARKANDSTLRSFIQKNFGYDESTIARAIQIFRNEKI